MRAFGKSWVATCLLVAVAPIGARAQAPAASKLLEFTPAQKDVPVAYDSPASNEEVDACKASTAQDPKTRGFAYELRDGQGRMLRRFFNDGKKNAQGAQPLNNWSYYRDGFEVYRDVDVDMDGFADEGRWLNAGGTRIALVRKNRVTAWKRLSAEEASKVLVQALIANNPALLETIMATPAELSALGVPKGVVDRQAAEIAGLAGGFAAVRKGLTGWDAQTVWMRFDGTMPHVIPADAGLTADLIQYENAFVFAGPATGQADPTKFAYLQVPEVVRIGETWKLVGTPKPINPAEPVAIASEFSIRSEVYRGGAPQADGARTPELEEVLKELAEHDRKAPGFDATKQDLAAWHHQRVQVLHKAIKLADDETDRTNYTKQAIDSIAAAYQTGFFKQGAEVLKSYADQPGAIGPYAAYRQVLAEYTLDADQPGANFIQVQKDFLAKLETFVAERPKAEEVPDVLFQLASINEFNAEVDKARAYYAKLADEHDGSPLSEKARGALRRLDLVGKPIEFTGAGLNGKPVATSQYKGKPLLITFWTSKADPVRKDLPDLVNVYNKYKSRGFSIIGINLDVEKAAADEFLKASPLPWPQVFEPGGMDSRPANEFGIISLPTMILVGADGKVVSCGIRNAADLDRSLERLLPAPGAAAGLNLGTIPR